MCLRLSHWLTLLVFATFWVGAAEPLPAPREKQAEPAEQKDAAAKNQPTQPAPIVIINNIPAAEQKNEPAQKPDPWPPMWTIVAGLVITGGASLIALWTVRSIREQARGTTRAAMAAEQSAQAAADNVLATKQLANLERPWLMFHPNDPTNAAKEKIWPFNDPEYGVKYTAFRVDWNVITVGRST